MLDPQIQSICSADLRRCGGSCPELIDLIWKRQIAPGKVFDLTLSMEQAAEGCKAMDERRAVKVLPRG